MKIIIVEDEVRTREGLMNLIKELSLDYEIMYVAENGLEGLKYIDELRPDLVISDIKMPKMDGLEMLAQLKQRGVTHKTIILSGFADFEYAKTAIQIGVNEYLLKPITVEDLDNVIKKINEQLLIEKEKEKSSLIGFSNPNAVFESLLLSNDEMEEIAMYQLEEKFDIGIEKNYFLMIVYLGVDSKSIRGRVDTIIGELLSGYSDKKYYKTSLEIKKEILYIFPESFEFNLLDNYCKTTVLKILRKDGYNNIILGCTVINSIRAIKKELDILRGELKWSIVLGEDVLVSYPKTRNINFKQLQYPFQIEKDIIAAIISMEIPKINKSIAEFLACWRKEIYHPDHVIEAFVRFVSSVTNAIRDLDFELYNIVNQTETIKRITNSISMEELTKTIDEFVQKITQKYEKKESKLYSINVKKVLNMIDEYYGQGINLEEIADSLHVTPEYLGSLFNKEVGKSFSAFLKGLRIRKAKELLLNTNLKSYEIASKLGFSDSKYFFRIFKEVTGLSTSEYIKKYK